MWVDYRGSLRESTMMGRSQHFFVPQGLTDWVQHPSKKQHQVHVPSCFLMPLSLHWSLLFEAERASFLVLVHSYRQPTGEGFV